MRRIVLLAAVFLAAVGVLPVRADDVSDMKVEMLKMREEQEKQLKLIGDQDRMIRALVEKVAALEKAGPAKEAPEDSKETAPKAAAPNDLKVCYKDGVCFATEDKKFDLKVGGRLNYDVVALDEDARMRGRFGKVKDDGEMRRARFSMSGNAYKDFFYKLEYDFVSDPVSLKDAYIGYKGIPYLGSVQAGHFYEPFGFENIVSTNYLQFVEYGLPVAFSPVRNAGIMLFNDAFEQRMTWATGVFRDADDTGRLTSNESNWTSRVTALPWYEDEGAKLLHVGGSYSLRYPEDTVRYASRPESHLSPNFVDTGNIKARSVNLYGTEAAVVLGPLSFVSEYQGSVVDQSGFGSHRDLHGLYAYGSFFLTGEHMPYSKTQGLFTRLKPHHNFSISDGTFGAVELVARYSYLDLKDEGVSGGILSDSTIGINWYLTPNVKAMINYIHANLNGVGRADIALTRIQVDF
ncbi:MAG: porin [Candidatus Omnitrophica bacterium]|nr:porin [Candidatus Omnitrophota bacterium]